jgi:hypothetical protein
MKLKKVVLGVAVIVLAAVAFAVYYVVVSLDEIVRTAIEDYGSEIMGTSVQVSSVSIQLREGKGAIRGLRVANPDGFPPGDTISLGEISLGIDAGSLISRDPIVITLIDVVEPSVLLVTDAQGGSNLQTIQANTARYAGGGGGRGGDGGAAANSEEPPVRLSIRKFTFEGGLLAADLTAVGGKRVEAKLPPLRLSNVGGEKGGTPGEIGTAVAGAFVKNSLTAVARSQIDDQLDRLLDEKLGGSEGKAAKDVLKGLFGK